MQHILVPTDFSPEAHNAFEVALQLAQRTGGRVLLLHVLLDAPSGGGAMVTTGGRTSGGDLDDLFMVRRLQMTKHRMARLLAEAAETAPAVRVLDMVETGTLEEAVLELIGRHQINLVVIGAHEHASARPLFGPDSYAERLVRRATCPVLTVKHPAPAFAAHTIVFASDFAPEADRAVPALRQLQAAFPGAMLRLLDVATGAARRAAALARIHDFARRHALPNCQPTVHDEARVPAGIQPYAADAHTDLVVMLSHGHTGLWHLLQGSIAERVAVQTAAPVLTFHPWEQIEVGAGARTSAQPA
ncbi:universal stress protein [uncultured Hymenobacter sp.]|uniref:universal stress protein n=1 Tax=uncultured Hymenobacter sp. TaxID=170016 RepID=UPI0035CC9CDC